MTAPDGALAALAAGDVVRVDLDGGCRVAGEVVG